MIVTLSNNYYLIYLNQLDLIPVRNGIRFGYQQVNIGLFMSFVTSIKKNGCKKQEIYDINEIL